ncbi:DUF6779 domain-containing protein [Lolliginicoccus levis]|uniref:DUF6779 domain-containing protein n=1 Tax=Lolliginicoccus levis TaxID=2919542 RepID=UPI00241E8D37|nr:DUF6779 domain-containing protein [Lolliginicoccus levis]
MPEHAGPQQDSPHARRARHRRRGSSLLALVVVLSAAASVFLMLSTSVEALRIGFVIALWAAIIGVVAVVKYRKETEAERARIRDMRLVYEMQLSREITSRRRHELTVEARLRRELDTRSRTETAEQLAALRHEMASMRGHVEYALATRSTVEQIEVREIGPAGDSPIAVAGAPEEVVDAELEDDIGADRATARAE